MLCLAWAGRMLSRLVTLREKLDSPRQGDVLLPPPHGTVNVGRLQLASGEATQSEQVVCSSRTDCSPRSHRLAPGLVDHLGSCLRRLVVRCRASGRCLHCAGPCVAWPVLGERCRVGTG